MDIDLLSERLLAKLGPQIKAEAQQCEMMHRGLVDEFKEVVSVEREIFKKELGKIRNDVYEKGTGKTWEERGEVKAGIAFALTLKDLTWKVFVALAIMGLTALCAWLGLRQ